MLDNDPNIAIKNHPLVQKAQAELDKANLYLSYTTTYAPVDGIVTKVDKLQVGDYITRGAVVFSLISVDDIWVEANFKETQITYMRPGQRVKIKIDAYSDVKFEGKVNSLTPGTGSSFSLLPPENATGNWVKIVQRVPVRITISNWSDFPPNTFLVLSGLSATVTVDTEKKHFSIPTSNQEKSKAK
jgi:membrane fusion protein (multidrug efflux system)